MSKPKLALYWAASCGGCEVAVLDVAEKILDVAGFFDIVFWPCAMDFKYKDVEAMADGDIDLCCSTAPSGIAKTKRWRTCCAAKRRSW